MVNPVPGKSVGTKYGVRGQHWSCQKTSAGGIHTGLDIPAPNGTTIVAPIAGTIRHRSYGSAFGSKQFAISPSPGQPFEAGEVFFAHTKSRPPDGTEVVAGQTIAEVGSEGNVTGPHLHLEFMPSTKKQWKCGLHSDPQRIIDWQPTTTPPPPAPEAPVTARIVYQYSGKPAKTQSIGDAYTKVTDGRFICPGDGWLFTMCYLNLSHAKGKTGGIRNRLVRENPTDETCYQDHAVTKDLVAPGSFLLQPVWFGAAQKGRPFHWSVRRSKSLGATTASTRYAKWLWISSELALPPTAGRSVTPPPRRGWLHLVWLWLRAVFSDGARREWLNRNAPSREDIQERLLSRPEIAATLARFFADAAEEGDDPVLLEIE